MEPATFGEIALRRREINNPLSLESLDRIIARCDPPAGARVVDVGCGKGTFLIRLAELRLVHGEGIDLSERSIESARSQSALRPRQGSLRFRCVDAKSELPPTPPYFLVVCLGATHAFGGLRATLETLREWTQPGGWIVVGDGYWKQPPSPEYLEVLDAAPAELHDDRGNVQVGVELGLTLVDHWSSSDEEWDDFEGAYLEGIESFARENPTDPDVPGMLGRIRRWRQAYLRWGKETLGFGVYVFRTKLGTSTDEPRSPGDRAPDPPRTALPS